VSVAFQCMVHIKFVAHPKIPVFSSDYESMASDGVPEISVQHKEASTEQLKVSL
jgi:hypothetical protein